MSQKDKRVEAVAALIADRRKYEGWLAALEAKRSETPDHVFFRVRSDYERRLSEVLEKLRSQASALNERAEALNARLATLMEQERSSYDRKHEAELRVSVGEFSQKAWEELLKETADTAARIAAERTTIQAELTEIRELLGGGKGPPGSASKDQRSAARTAEPPELPPDELAFLRSLITTDAGSTKVGGSLPTAASPPPLLDPRRSGRDTPPLSVDSEAIVIRSDKDGKTLKCAECGALNVPTEWYCEECGSELATL
jgi:primosomal protein N'